MDPPCTFPPFNAFLSFFGHQKMLGTSEQLGMRSRCFDPASHRPSKRVTSAWVSPALGTGNLWGNQRRCPHPKRKGIGPLLTFYSLVKRSSTSPLQNSAIAACRNSLLPFWRFLVSTKPANENDLSTAAEVTGYLWAGLYGHGWGISWIA